MKKYTGLLDKYKLYKQRLNTENITNNTNDNENKTHATIPTSNSHKPDIQLRDILGEYMDFSIYPAGEYSFPGPDITFTAPASNSMVICLGCMENIDGGDTINISWPKTQIPASFATGSSGVNATVYTGDLSLNPVNWLPLFLPELGTPEYQDFTFPNQTYVSTTNPESPGQPHTTNLTANRSDPNAEFGSNRLTGGINTPFQAPHKVGLNSETMNLAASANYYSAVNLSQEGMLWTLWPLAKPKKNTTHGGSHVKTTYFNNLKFGTAMNSNYRIGQLGYFYNNINEGCIPMGSDLSLVTVQSRPVIDIQLAGQIGINSQVSTNAKQSTQQINPGVQGFYRSLLISTDQLLSVLVVKVSEEIARVPNPASGEMGQDRFIYVGYDGWAVVRTSANPVGPMMAQTYVTPQTVTGNLNAKDNYQVIIPPNFISTVYYKNRERNVPTDTRSGISNPGLYVPFYSDDNRFVNQTDEFLRGLASAIAELGNPELNDIISQVNNINNPYEVINLINAITTPEYLNTTLGGRPLPVNIVPFNNIIEQQRLSLRTDEDRGTINFDLNNGMPTYIDGQLQLYPRFSSSIRPYAQALVNSPPADISNLDDIITPGRN